jgi:hypothetical protein
MPDMEERVVETLVAQWQTWSRDELLRWNEWSQSMPSRRILRTFVIQGGYTGLQRRWSGEPSLHTYRFRVGYVDEFPFRNALWWNTDKAFITHQWPLEQEISLWGLDMTRRIDATPVFPERRLVSTRWLDETLQMALTFPVTTLAEAALCLWPDRLYMTSLDLIVDRFVRENNSELRYDQRAIKHFLMRAIVQRHVPITPLVEGLSVGVLG